MIEIFFHDHELGTINLFLQKNVQNKILQDENITRSVSNSIHSTTAVAV